MNSFQKQLMLGDKSMAELSGQHRDGVGQVVPPARVSIEEFEATQLRMKPTSRRRRRNATCPYCKRESKGWD